MARHRAPTSRSHAVAALTVAGAALGTTVINPMTASATPLVGADLPLGDIADGVTAGLLAEAAPTALHAGSRSDGRYTATRRYRDHDSDQVRHRRAPRPMTSGEQQYRNGCRQGYIVEQCERFTVRNLLRRGINPYL